MIGIVTMPRTAPLIQKLIQAFKYVGLVQLYSFAVLFCILLSVATNTIAVMEERMTVYGAVEDERPSKEWLLVFDKLKADYSVVCDFVEQVNRCFGPPLLVTLTCEFVRVVNSSFNLLENAQELASFAMDELSTLGFLMSELVFIVIVTSTSHRVHAKVNYTSY